MTQKKFILLRNFVGEGINFLYSKTKGLLMPVENESNNIFLIKFSQNSQATNKILESILHALINLI